MSALRRSARGKPSQPETEHETPSVLDLHEAPPPTNQQTGANANAKGKRAPSKAKPAPKSAAPADLRAAESDVEAEIEPSSSTQSAPRKWGRPKAQRTTEDPAAQIVEPVEKRQKISSLTTAENPGPRAKKPIPQ